jgi:HJR/Mrr/RecB family endonuclease
MVMRWLVICLVAACGRINFNALSDDGGSAGGDDGGPAGSDGGGSPGLEVAPILVGQQAYVKASNTDTDDGFGSAVALSADGSTMAVGARAEASAAIGIGGNQASNSAPVAGAVYVFTRSGTTWSQQAYVKASNTNRSDGFGSSVALSSDGSLLAVGAPGEASSAKGINGNQGDNSAQSAGAVYVFARSGDVWTQTAYLKASNTDGGDNFGGALALSADGATLAVGARSEASKATGIDGDQTDNSLSNSGAVYVFVNSGTAWSQQAYIKASNPDQYDAFGANLALSDDGSTLAASAPGEASGATGIDGDQTDNTFEDAGAVYLFSRAGASWTQQAYIKASNANSLDGFGDSVALSGDGTTLAVGAVWEESAATGIDGDQFLNGTMLAGAAYVFSRGSRWTQSAYVKASNTRTFFFFGSAVGLNRDGTLLVVGASGESGTVAGLNGDQKTNTADGAGAAYRFARLTSGWTQAVYIKSSNTRMGANFGAPLALSRDGSTLAIAAARESSNATGINGNQADSSAGWAGAVYVFQ